MGLKEFFVIDKLKIKVFFLLLIITAISFFLVILCTMSSPVGDVPISCYFPLYSLYLFGGISFIFGDMSDRFFIGIMGGWFRIFFVILIQVLYSYFLTCFIAAILNYRKIKLGE